MAFIATGQPHIGDAGNNRVVKVINGQLSIVANTGEVGASGDSGAVTVKAVNSEGTQITAMLAIAHAAQTTGRNITVTNPAGDSFTKHGAFAIK